MEIENHKEEVPFAFYEEKFHALRSDEVTARLSDVRWDGTEFTIRLLGRDFSIAHPDYAIRALDDTRLVVEASGWYDQGGGDVYSLHNYFYPLRVRPQTRTVALSEYGGIAWPMPGHEPPRKTYGYGTAKSREELTARYKKLQRGAVLPQLQKGLSALVYTQLTDVEDEVNGLFTYDRTAIKPDANAVRSVNAALAAEFAKVIK